MCGRYVRRSDKQAIAEYFRASPQPAELLMPGADYNVAPTTFQPIIRQSRESPEREIILARWGLIPFFTKQLSDIKGLSTINARAESIATAPTWREPMKKRRCIVPCNSFYEWVKDSKPPKTPYSFELTNGSPMGFAGLWDAWKDRDGHWLQSFAIATTSANELMSRVHPPPARLRPLARPPRNRTPAPRSPPAPRLRRHGDVRSTPVSRKRAKQWAGANAGCG